MDPVYEYWSQIMTNKKNIEVKLKRKLKEQSCELCAYGGGGGVGGVWGNQNKDTKGLLWGENYRRKFWSFFYVYCCRVGVPGDQDFSPISMDWRIKKARILVR